MTGSRHEFQPRIEGSLDLKKVDVLYICALPVETNAVISTLDKRYDDPTNLDNNMYFTCSFIDAVKIAILSLTRSGMVSSSINAQYVSEVIKSRFSRSIFIIATGICAGVGYHKESDGEIKDVLLGDVVISTKVRKYAHGLKYDNSVYSTAEDQDTIRDAPEELQSKLHHFEYADHAHRFLLRVQSCLEHVQSRIEAKEFEYFKGGMPSTRPPIGSDDRLYEADHVHLHREGCKNGCDPVSKHACDTARDSTCQVAGCGNDLLERGPPERRQRIPGIFWGIYGSEDLVLRSPNIRKELFDQGITAVEMEGRGIWQAGLKSKHTVVIIKGISDYADSHKQDDWQSFAATTAACCAKEFVRQFLKTTSEGITSESHE